MNAITKFSQDESGPTSVEYAVMLAFILMVCFVAIQTLGTTTASIWTNNQQQLENM
ncbi:Flp family type IVb pilin [Planctomicrobium sp. SH527]|uniref:Flp family type IVb pilin n=1 Tax=Planctomicrobium sp. SH527 TaxID=3448123 RepID=UPI003F5C0989